MDEDRAHPVAEEQRRERGCAPCFVPLCGRAADYFGGVHCSRVFWLSRASRASSSRGNRNSKPAAISLPEMTRRLLMISSVSVRRKNAPASSIQWLAGKPIDIPHILRNARIISALVTGLGAARFTTPLTPSCSSSQSIARQKSSSWIQETNCLPFPILPPRPTRASLRSTGNTLFLPWPRTIAERNAILRVAGVFSASKAFSQARATSTENSSFACGALPVSPDSSHAGPNVCL